MGTIPMPIVQEMNPSQDDETDPELSEGAPRLMPHNHDEDIRRWGGYANLTEPL